MRGDSGAPKVPKLGYGLTLGLQARIDSRAQALAASAHVGHIYVNRNMIGAVVGVQPFGGEGLSGTGSKAGRPRYLLRLCTGADGDDQHHGGRGQCGLAGGMSERPGGETSGRADPAQASAGWRWLVRVHLTGRAIIQGNFYPGINSNSR